jgi:hypothetical protein
MAWAVLTIGIGQDNPRASSVWLIWRVMAGSFPG